MIIYLTSTLKDGYIKISDNDTFLTKPSFKKKYILEFIDGRMTLPFFKKLQKNYDSKNILFLVLNVEYFISVFKDFRDFQIIEIDNECINNDDLNCNNKNYLSNYNYQDKENVKLPFIFESIQTSLMRPDLYLNENHICKEIIKKIKNKEEIGESETLKSLILFGAVTKNGKNYKLNF